ncbi:MAG TPA: FG-GAP-like repeat-containing protein, partial [Thermoanaerobaculia bacterium]|nr:FG-GAP-like repeat-containing protein [Thermoanaerobaculia bacterium]
RALAAAGSAALAICAAIYFTRGEADSPYRPGEKVEGLTDVHRARVAGDADWSITWKDVAAKSGIDFRHFSGGARSTQLPEDMGSGCAFADYDRDGDWDLFVADTSGPLTLSAEAMRKAPGGCRLYRNDGGVFTDVTRAAGLDDLKGVFLGAAWGDFDNDGYPDLAVTSYGEIRLFHNRGDGTLEDVSKPSGVGGRRGFWTGAVWGDADSDGRLDLYVCNYVDYRFDPKDAGRTSKFGAAASPFTINPESYPPVPNLFFLNEGRGRFREMAEEAGVSNPTGRSLSAAFADFNDDSRPDLYVANDVSEGALFVNEDEGIFSDRGREAHVADYRGSMGIAVGDADGDGAMDMFVTHWIAEANAFYLNKRLKKSGLGALDFEDAAERFGLGQISTDDIGWGTAFLDVDADSWPDLVAVNGSTFEDPVDTRKLIAMPMRLFWNRGGKRFADVAPLSGTELVRPRVGRGLAIADVDGDLREEIAVVVHGGKLALLKAEGGPANHRIAFRCEGTSSNRSAFGTKLVLESGGTAQRREVNATPSYLSQNAPEAIFGLGVKSRVERLTVRWPSGSTQVFTDLPADRAYRIVEGDREAHPVEDRRARTLAFWDAYRRARDAAAGGRTAEAIAGYREALSIDPRHEDSLYVLGNLYFEAGDRPAAKAAFESLLSVQPRSARAHGALGDLLADPASGSLSNLREARLQFERAGGLNAEETGWVVRIGEVSLREMDARAAEQQFRKVLATNPRSFPALYLLGYLAWRRGDPVEAGRLFDSAFRALGP